MVDALASTPSQGGKPLLQDASSAAPSLRLHIPLASLPPRPGVKVDISEEGERLLRIEMPAPLKPQAPGAAKSSQSESRYEDIDDSELPDQIKAILRHIRDLKLRLQEIQNELARVMSDRKLSEEQRELKAASLRAEMSAISGGLVLANRKLLDAMREMDLGSEEMQKAATLAMR